MIEFASNRLHNSRAGEADVVELPVAHRVKLNDRRSLHAAGEICQPPRFHGDNQAAAPGLGPVFHSSRRAK